MPWSASTAPKTQARQAAGVESLWLVHGLMASVREIALTLKVSEPNFKREWAAARDGFYDVHDPDAC